MSYLGDTVSILSDEAAIFAFLPAINYVYFFVYFGEVNPVAVFFVVVSLLFSSALYNFLTETTFRSNKGSTNDLTAEDTKENNSQNRKGIVFGGILIGWLPLFASSIIDLSRIFSANSIIAELLVVISIFFVCHLFTDSVLNTILQSYGKGEEDSE